MQKNQNFLTFLFKDIKIVSILNEGYFFLNLFLINIKDFLWIFVSIILLKNFLLFIIFAAPQSWWLITILKTIKAGGCNCSRANFTGAYFAALKGSNSIPNDWIKKTIPAKKVLNQK